MWSMCSISTGHCSTQAPQLVQDHSTSGSITPISPAATSCSNGMSAWASTEGSSRTAVVAPSPENMPPLCFSSLRVAFRYGADSMAWSRRLVTSSFGLSGFAVFHAGHCSWQRPHSVHEVKSIQPFQVKSSILPTPIASSSGSAFSMVSMRPPEVSGFAAPRALRPSELRFRKMLKKAMKRCHATPHLMFWPTINSQIIPESSLISAKMETSSGDSGRILATCMVKKSVATWPPS